jgi:hypothetical protein
MIDFWRTIELRLHEESQLHHPLNEVKKILKSYINGALNEYDEFDQDLIKDAFLKTCTDVYLDERGAEYGLLRNTDETDDEFRSRIMNANNLNLSVNFMKKQGMTLYSKKKVDDKIRLKLSSMNPYMSRYYACIPDNITVSDFVENKVIHRKTLEIYKRGW